MNNRLALIMGLTACSPSSPSSTNETSSTARLCTSTIAAAADVAQRSFEATFVESDPALTRAVELAIAHDAFLSRASKNVVVTVERGVATLRGSVAEPATREALERVVVRVPGVVRAHDELHVSPLRDGDDAESDESIAFRLQRSFVSDQQVAREAETVTIEVVHGKVTLRGTTLDVATRDAVTRIVRETPGTVSVSNELRVRGPSAGPRP